MAFTAYDWDWLDISYWSSKWLWSVFGTIGNVITLMAIWKFENLQTVTNYNIVSLAVADFMQGIMQCSVSLATDLTTEKNKVWISLCAVRLLLGYIGASCNIMTICWVAVDRFIFIHRPLHYYAIITKKAVFLWLGISWAYFTAICILSVALVSPEIYRLGTCDLNISKHPFNVSYLIQVHFWVISVVTWFLYIRISYTAYKHDRKIRQEGRHPNVSAGRRITKMMASVIGVYLVLNLPVIVVMLVGIYEDSSSMMDKCILYISYAMFHINVWINPVLYYNKNKDFKMAFKNIMHLD